MLRFDVQLVLAERARLGCEGGRRSSGGHECFVMSIGVESQAHC